MKTSKLMLFACILGLALTVSAQKSWEKPLQKWSKEDALQVLKESPWAQNYQSAEGSVAAEMQQSAREQADQRIIGRGEMGRLNRQLAVQPVIIRLQSGLPIRQALVRLQQIEAGYDKMNEDQRAGFDARTKEFLDCPVCKNYYVVTLTKFRKSSSEGVDDAIFQTLKLEHLKGNIQLVNDSGEVRELEHFIVPTRAGESAVLFFKRKDAKGNLLITPETKNFKMVFNRNFLTDRTNPYGGLLPNNFEFKVSKLMIKEEMAF